LVVYIGQVLAGFETHGFEPFSRHVRSPNRNFSFEQQKKIDKFRLKTDNCGRKHINLVGRNAKGEIVDSSLPVYCDNRSCMDSGCKKHRYYQYKKKHQPQINYLHQTIKKPKGYVFTGFHLDLLNTSVDDLKIRCRKRHLFLFKILQKLSKTPFSMHQELKLYPAKCSRDSDICKSCSKSCSHGSSCPKYGTAFLHWHVVSGFIDVKKARNLWKRVVKYEEAIKREELEKYVSKYASKTPFFADELIQEVYFLVTYKQHMHRYSVPQKDCLDVTEESEFILEDDIILDVYRTKKAQHRYGGNYYDPWYEKRRKEVSIIEEWKDGDEPPPPDFCYGNQFELASKEREYREEKKRCFDCT